MSGRTLLVNRTPGHDGEVLKWGGEFSGYSSTYRSSGQIDLYDIDYYGVADNVEVVLEWTAQAPGATWGACDPTKAQGLHIIRCNSVGSFADFALGTWNFSTSLVAPCSDPNKTKTDTETFTLTEYFSILGRLGEPEETTFDPHLKWCWSGTRIVSVIKEQNTWYVGGPFDSPDITRTVELVNNDSPFIDNSTLPQAGRYHAEFIITFKGTDIDGPWTVKDRIQIDRTYLAGGTKEKDDKWLSSTVSRP